MVAGYSKLASVMGMASSWRDALESEHTTRGDSFTRDWESHSRIDCPTREIEGAQNRTSPLPFR